MLRAEVQPAVPVEPGKAERVDYEYERRGRRNLFVMVETFPPAEAAASEGYTTRYTIDIHEYKR